MIRWTRSGAVSSPEVLQLRVSASFAERVPAGAPMPSRDLREDELRIAVEHFTAGRRGPRSRPVRGLVLSGDPSVIPGGWSWVRASRALGIERLILHSSLQTARALPDEARADIDAVAVRLPDVDAARRLGELEGSWFLTVVILLDHATLSHLAELLAAVARNPPDRVVFTWPLGGTEPPPLDRVLPELERHGAPLHARGIPCALKGVPECVARRHRSSLPRWRSGNRWYVDADHPPERALLFFPDIFRFVKVEACRFCSASAGCDGVPEAWVHTPLCGPIEPV